jgi:hypothetical protein
VQRLDGLLAKSCKTSWLSARECKARTKTSVITVDKVSASGRVRRLSLDIASQEEACQRSLHDLRTFLTSLLNSYIFFYRDRAGKEANVDTIAVDGLIIGHYVTFVGRE